jgi:hypothetical protein
MTIRERRESQFHEGDRVIYMGKSHTIGTVERVAYPMAWVRRDGWVQPAPFLLSDLTVVQSVRHD